MHTLRLRSVIVFIAACGSLFALFAASTGAQRPQPVPSHPIVQPSSARPAGATSTRELSMFKSSLLTKITAAAVGAPPTAGSSFRLPFSGAASMLGAPGANAAVFKVENQAPPTSVVFTAGIEGRGPTGVLGVSSAPDGNGVAGVVLGDATTGAGVRGSANNQGSGVEGFGGTASSNGVHGQNLAVGTEAWLATRDHGVYAHLKKQISGPPISEASLASSGYAIYGASNALDGAGVYGRSTLGGRSVGVLGESAVGWAGFFRGKVHVTGTLSSAAKQFTIPHPTDPSRTLSHSSVESDELKNVYDGTVLLNAAGRAVVRLPSWFESLNKDFRYQLTPIGSPAPNLHISREVAGGRFSIAGGRPGTKVCWQLTGIRHDPYARSHPLVVESTK